MSKISAIELIELLPTDVFSHLAQETSVDYKVHKLKGAQQEASQNHSEFDRDVSQ